MSEGWQSTDFSDGWWNERVQEAEAETEYSDFNPWEEQILDMRDDGVYFIRLLPVYRDSPHWYKTVGEHWSLFPSEAEGTPRMIPCAKVTWGKPCIPCEAADAMIANKHAKRSDLYGLGKWGVRKRFMLRGLLVKFKANEERYDYSRVPELPIVRGILVGSLIFNKLVKLVRPDDDMEENFAAAVFDPIKGSCLRIERNKSLKNNWDIQLARKQWPIPTEFADRTKWPDFQFLAQERFPLISVGDQKKLFTMFGDDMAETLDEGIQILNSIDTTLASPKALPAGDDDAPWDDEPRKEVKKGKYDKSLDDELADI